MCDINMFITGTALQENKLKHLVSCRKKTRVTDRPTVITVDQCQEVVWVDRSVRRREQRVTRVARDFLGAKKNNRRKRKGYALQLMSPSSSQHNNIIITECCAVVTRNTVGRLVWAWNREKNRFYTGTQRRWIPVTALHTNETD